MLDFFASVALRLPREIKAIIITNFSLSRGSLSINSTISTLSDAAKKPTLTGGFFWMARAKSTCNSFFLASESYFSVAIKASGHIYAMF
jgi:hypothetical protein